MTNPSITQEIPKILTAYQQFMYRLMRGAAQEAKTTLKTNKNYATSQLMQSISGDSVIQGHNITGSFGANTKYAESVEFGRNPGKMPPVKAIFEWLQRKSILGHIEIDYATKRGYKHANLKSKSVKTFYESQDAIGKAAWGYAKHIAKFGTKPHPYLRPAYEQMITKFNAETPLEIK